MKQVTSIRSALAFTVVEALIALALLALVMAGTISLLIMIERMWHRMELNMQTVQDGGIALGRLVYGLGTNSGLRAASRVTLNTNVYGYRNSSYTNYPLAAADGAAHQVYAAGGGNNPDGSWRLAVYNDFNRTNWIDYNRNASNIVMWPTPNQPASRQLIGNYVAAAVVIPNSNGLSITLTLSQQRGFFYSTNQVQTFIRYRNL